MARTERPLEPPRPDRSAQAGGFPEGTDTQARLRAQYDIVEALAGAATLAEAAPEILRAVGQAIGWAVGGLWVVDEDAGVLRCLATWHAPGVDVREFEEVSLTTTFEPGVGLPGRVWQTRTSAWITDVTRDLNFPRASAAERVGLHAGFAFPILFDGNVLAIIEFFGREPLLPEQGLVDMMSAVGMQVGQFVQRKRMEEAISKSDARKTAILASAMDSVIVIDHRGHIVEFNPAAEKTFGHRRSDVLGKKMANLLIPPHLREAHARGLEHYLRTGEGPLIGKRIEVPALRADGTEFLAELAVTAVEHEGVTLFAGYLRDITDRMKADRERDHLLKLERQARAEAEAAQQRLAFLAEAGMKVASSLDFSQALQRLAEAAVPYMADWCFVDLQDEAGSVHRVAFAHALAADEALVRRLQRPVADPTSSHGISKVLSSGESVLASEVTEDILRSLAPTPERLETLRSLGPRSYMIVPLHSREKTIGSVAFVLTGSQRSYREDDLTLAEDLVRRASISIDNARLYQERTFVARALQRSLLPPSLPRIPGVELAAYYEPASEDIDVGGDFYDVFPLGRRRWAIVIGDVCGKGAEAAAITGLARHTLRAAATQVRDPEAILKVMNESIAGQIRDERFCSVALACLEKSRDRARVTVVTAGHPPPLLFRADGTVEPVGEPGDLLGLFPEVEFVPTEIDLALGDGLLLYTDGVTEARRRERVFGLYGLRRVLEGSVGLSAAAVSRRVRDAVLQFQERSRDDLAVLALKLARPSHTRPVSFSLDLAGGFKAAEAARRSLDGLNEELSSELLEDARLLVNELVTNAVRHARVGTGETIRLTVTVSPELVRAEVKDPGMGFEPPAGWPTWEQGAGWGLYLVERFADRWGVDDSDGTCVWFEIDR